MHLNISWIAAKQLESRSVKFDVRLAGYIRFLRGNLGFPQKPSGHFLNEIEGGKVGCVCIHTYTNVCTCMHRMYIVRIHMRTGPVL